jgi:lysophospholipase L1-like esterase
MFYSTKKRGAWTLGALTLAAVGLSGCATLGEPSAPARTESAPVVLSSPAPVAPPAVRILVVGDSITQGGKRNREEYTYRLPLQRLLQARGVAFDFLGTRSAGLHEDATWPEIAPGVPFDPDHAGYYGRKTAYVCGQVMAALPSMPVVPNVVLVHLGTNDQNSADPAAEVAAPLRELVVALRARNPRVAVLLGHLNFNDSKGANAIRPLVEALASELDTPESPVLTVHHYRGWNEKPRQPASDTFDWAHPNPVGQEKMAHAWLEAMGPALSRLGWSAPLGEPVAAAPGL